MIYTDRQTSAARSLAYAGYDLFECKHSYDDRCEHAHVAEDAARAFIAAIDPEPALHGLTDEQVEALNTASCALLERHWELSEALEEAFPEVFAEPKPVHPWDIVILQPGDVAVWREGGVKMSINLANDDSVTCWRTLWSKASDTIADWQFFRPTWTSNTNEKENR